jgi:hypothetical protein
MAVSPVQRSGAAAAIGVLAVTLGLQVGVAFLALTLPASAPAEAHDVGRSALIAIVVATGAIGAFLIWRAPRTQNIEDRLDALGGGVELDSAPGQGTQLRGHLAAMAVAMSPRG